MVQSIFKMESQTKQGQSSSEGEYTEKISNAIWVCQPRGSHKWQQTQNRSLCSCWFVYCYFKFSFFIPTHRQWWMECVSLVLVCADQRRNWCIDRVGRQIIAPPNGNTVECSRFSIEVKITIPKQYNSTSYDKRHTHVGRASSLHESTTFTVEWRSSGCPSIYALFYICNAFVAKRDIFSRCQHTHNRLPSTHCRLSLLVLPLRFDANNGPPAFPMVEWPGARISCRPQLTGSAHKLRSNSVALSHTLANQHSTATWIHHNLRSARIEYVWKRCKPTVKCQNIKIEPTRIKNNSNMNIIIIINIINWIVLNHDRIELWFSRIKKKIWKGARSLCDPCMSLACANGSISTLSFIHQRSSVFEHFSTISNFNRAEI